MFSVYQDSKFTKSRGGILFQMVCAGPRQQCNAWARHEGEQFKHKSNHPIENLLLPPSQNNCCEFVQDLIQIHDTYFWTEGIVVWLCWQNKNPHMSSVKQQCLLVQFSCAHEFICAVLFHSLLFFLNSLYFCATDTSSTSFYKAISVIKYVQACLPNADTRRPLSDRDRLKVLHLSTQNIAQKMFQQLTFGFSFFLD